MVPYVSPILATDAVKAFVGQLPNTRIYDFGDVPQGTALPYVTWSLVGNQPYEHVSGAPLADNSRIQIDCYAGPADEAADEALALGRAVQAALDAAGFSNKVIIAMRERDTRFFRVSLEAYIIANH